MSTSSKKRRAVNPQQAKGATEIQTARPRDPIKEPAETLRRFYDSASVMMGIVEIVANDIVHISDNQAAATFFGTTPEAMHNRSARAMGVPEEYVKLWLQAYLASVTSVGPVRFDYHHVGKGWLTVTVNHIGLIDSRQRFLYVVDDITDRKSAEQQLQEAHDQLGARVKARTAELERAKIELEAANQRLQHDAFHDALTGLPNRVLFNDRLKHALERYHSNPDLGFAVLFMDLDHFKVINDSLGHPAGDALLKAVGERLVNCVREGDTVARFGGDEFILLLEHCDGARAAEVTWRLRRALGQPFELWGRTFTLSGSIGMVFSEVSHSHPQDLLRDADLAMYRAKVHHAGRHQVFMPDMREGAVLRLELEADLRRALEQQELEVHFQPVMRLTDLSLCGFEALVRWSHPTLGLLAPDAFVSLAEETSLIIQLDRFVLRAACQQLAKWHREFPDFEELSINVNLSSQQFLQRGLLKEVESALLQSDLSPKQLSLEITESLLMQPAAVVDEIKEQLVSLGVGLCLDDFGTGYASLSYLRRFPANGLKIDRSFIQDMSEGDKGVTLVEGIVRMAQKLGMRVVAEGIETPAQLAQLQVLGCEYGQGYVFSKPLTAAQARAFITKAPNEGASR